MSVSLVDQYQRQIAILHQMVQQSQRVRAYFDASRNEYRNQIEHSRQLGFMDDYVNELLQRYSELSARMDQLLQHMIQSELLASQQEERLRALIHRAQAHV